MRQDAVAWHAAGWEPKKAMRRAETHNDSSRLRPLRELPALIIDGTQADVRGWLVVGRDGRPLGHVSDLLADADSLQAHHLIVTIEAEAGAARQAETVLPVTALRAVPERRQLIADGGMTPIRLRYRSTTWLVWWVVGLLIVLATVLLVLDAWWR
jgi:hypothetical protein